MQVTQKKTCAQKNFRAAEKMWKQCEKMNQHALELQANAQKHAEAAWEEMSQGVQASLEVGGAFAEALEPSESKAPPIMKVKAVQQAARASFRQVSSAAIAVRRAREGWVKAAGQRRKTIQKESAAMVALAEAGDTSEMVHTN